MTLTDNDLDTILVHRAVEPPSGDFALRILRAAKLTQQSPKTSFMDTLRATFEYLIPHPAAAFASVLVLGLVIGLSTAGPDIFSTASTQLHVDMDDTGAIL